MIRLNPFEVMPMHVLLDVGLKPSLHVYTEYMLMYHKKHASQVQKSTQTDITANFNLYTSLDFKTSF